MARPLRIEFAGALYPVMSRGNDRRAIVREDADRQRRIDWLRRTVETYGWRLLAFDLMANHEHLFVETPEPNLSAGMQPLNGSYTGYYNVRHNRSECGDVGGWTPGRRADDGSRAVAAYPARRRYGYVVTEIAAALGYASHGGVVTAIRRIESGDARLLRAARDLESRLARD